MAMNLIQLFFSLITTTIIIYGSLINILEDRLPLFFRQTFRYGKFAVKGENTKACIEVPKSWFRHFYVLSSIIYTYLIYLVTSVYIFQHNVPKWFMEFLNITCGESRTAYTTPTRIYLAMILVTLQVYRRLYDTHFVSIFGKNSRINITQYLIGLIHYPGVGLAILCEAPLFANRFNFEEINLDISSLTNWDYFAVILFLFSWYHQHTCTKILADLRRNKKGIVVSDDHKLPEGDWFKYLSAPHQTAEILMYFSITILLWYNITWFFVFTWVLANQVETILLSHWWYQETFENFPKDRKALIPYLY